MNWRLYLYKSSRRWLHEMEVICKWTSMATRCAFMISYVVAASWRIWSNGFIHSFHPSQGLEEPPLHVDLDRHAAQHLHTTLRLTGTLTRPAVRLIVPITSSSESTNMRDVSLRSETSHGKGEDHAVSKLNSVPSCTLSDTRAHSMPNQSLRICRCTNDIFKCCGQLWSKTLLVTPIRA